MNVVDPRLPGNVPYDGDVVASRFGHQLLDQDAALSAARTGGDPSARAY